MSNYINEALSTDGKIAFNYNNVSFKTNSVNALLQHLAWQYNDTYVGVLKKVKFDSSTDFVARAIPNLSTNGTPLVFKGLTEETIGFKIGMSDEVYMLHMTYMFVDKPELMKYVAPNHVEFMVMLVNGIWFFLNRSENPDFFEKFDEINSSVYVSTDLPLVKLPSGVSMIDTVGGAKKALKQFAKSQNLKSFAISTFTALEAIELQAYPSISRHATFAPDVNEFATTEMGVPISGGVEIGYLVDNDNDRLIFLAEVMGQYKWFMIANKRYVDLITYDKQDFFVDSVKNSLISAEFNKNVSMDQIYETVTRNRAIGLLNGIQQEFDYSGYFYINCLGRTITKFNKLSVNKDGFVSKIVSTTPLVLYKDTIVTYSVNLKTGIALISIPAVKNEVYVVELNNTDLPELYNELIIGDDSTDVCMNISDVYFTDTAGK